MTVGTVALPADDARGTSGLDGPASTVVAAHAARMVEVFMVDSRVILQEIIQSLVLQANGFLQQLSKGARKQKKREMVGSLKRMRDCPRKGN